MAIVSSNLPAGHNHSLRSILIKCIQLIVSEYILHFEVVRRKVFFKIAELQCLYAFSKLKIFFIGMKRYFLLNEIFLPLLLNVK